MGSPPVIILMKNAVDVPLREGRHALLWKAVLQLPVQRQAQIRILAKSRGGDESDDIFQTNSITQSCGGGVRHLAVVSEAAMRRISSIVQCLLWQLLITSQRINRLPSKICSLFSVELREFRNSLRFNLILTSQAPITASTTKP